MINKYYNLILLFALLLFSSKALAGDQEQAEAENYPTTCQEAIDLILVNLNEDDKALLISINKEKLKGRAFISGWGKGIRDGFGLNEGNISLMESCHELREDASFHPVDTSTIIMEEVWQALR